MIYHGFLLILGNCQITIQILIHKLTPKNNGNRRVWIAYVFIRSALPDPLYFHTALPPECLTLNLHSASRLLAILGGNSSHSVDYSNRASYATLQNRFSSMLAAHCHHCMNLDAVTFIYSWRWLSRIWIFPLSIVCNSGWLRYSMGCQGTCSTEGKVSKAEWHSECPTLTEVKPKIGPKESVFCGINIWMHEAQFLITLNWSVYYGLLSKRKIDGNCLLKNPHHFQWHKNKEPFTVQLLAT